ncbi:hypothetical protein MMC14_006360 [Varicellaria rhodocarpa]|nr:hypothetical protein [Varicellaria rhodocarpa]
MGLLPKLVGGITIRERPEKYPGQPRYKRLDFVKERDIEKYEEWPVTTEVVRRRIPIYQETYKPPSNEPPQIEGPPSTPLPPLEPLWIHGGRLPCQIPYPDRRRIGYDPPYGGCPPPPPPPPSIPAIGPYVGPRHPPSPAQVAFQQPYRQIEYGRPLQVAQLFSDDDDDDDDSDSDDLEPNMAMPMWRDPYYVPIAPRPRKRTKTKIVPEKKKETRPEPKPKRHIRGESVFGDSDDEHRRRRKPVYDSDDSLKFSIITKRKPKK